MEKVIRNVLYSVIIGTRCIKSDEFCSYGSYVPHSLGNFDNKGLATKAIQLYKKALEHENKYVPIERSDAIERELFPEDKTPNYYKNLFEFINGNKCVSNFNMQIGVLEMKKILAEINGEQRFPDEQERIIAAMIRDYEYRLRVDKSTGSSEETIEEDKKKIKFLEDLRDGKIERK